MERCFSKSRFSKHFNRLSYLGVWPDDAMSLTKKKLYSVYQVFCCLCMLLAIGVQMVDLYAVFGNIRKMAFNLCTSVIVIFTLVKVLIILFFKKKALDKLRKDLWRDSLRLTDEEDVAIMEKAFKKLKFTADLFYSSGSIFFPAWIIVSYFSYKWGPRELPFPAYFPQVDIMKDRNYLPLLMYQTFSGGYIILVVIEIELALYSLILQMEAHYKILVKNILKLNEIYEEEPEMNGENGKVVKRREVNEFLKKKSTEELLISYIHRHLEIMEHSYTFEHIFHEFMLLHVIGSSILCVVNGLALSTVTFEILLKICYQAGYLGLIMVDLFFVCLFISNLTEECFNVGRALYKTKWYQMDSDLRKIICLMLARSQKPPKITTGKFFLMNLTTYLQMLKNIYSWLMLFRQVEVN